MRLQSVPLYKISDFLKSKGPDHYIPPTTICRNIAEALAKGPPDEFEQTAAEQQGGSITRTTSTRGSSPRPSSSY
jgi:hypothetical protein